MANATCSIDGCDRPALARSYCSMHYDRWRRHGDPLGGRRFAGSQPAPCSVRECNRPCVSKGLCGLHYGRLKRHGDPSKVLKKQRGVPCEVDGCTSPAHADGLCGSHYHRRRAHGDPLGGRARARDLGDSPIPIDPHATACGVGGCGRPINARGMCSLHYSRFRTHGDPLYERPKQSEQPCSNCGEACGPKGAKGMCGPCYGRYRRHGDPSIRLSNPLPETCTIDGCDSKPHARGWCVKHWNRWKTHGDPNAVVQHRTPSEDIAAFIDSIEPQDDCLIWPYSRHDFGYGLAGPSHGERRVHRLVCRRFHGPPPEGKPLALHACGNGAGGCVNPAHLYWGDAKDNRRDAERHGTAPIPRTGVGEAHYKAILTEAIVREIRATNKCDAEWAQELGVKPDTIHAARIGKNWKHVT